MNNKNKNRIWAVFIICFALLGCSKMDSKVHITDIKIATAVDENIVPVKVTNIFPKGTTGVFCWFKWQDSEINTPIVAKWDYETDNIHVLDYTFSIPRRNGRGSVSLSMPEGKPMPSGSYRITLALGKQDLKSLTFEIQ
ncbi:MAG: hypothetical protein Q7K71_03810 [Candidatus Omnitrophota bacterium]|nr:hypothetical protein [Candidatus Omnitrophota bacterium]